MIPPTVGADRCVRPKNEQHVSTISSVTTCKRLSLLLEEGVRQSREGDRKPRTTKGRHTGLPLQQRGTTTPHRRGGPMCPPARQFTSRRSEQLVRPRADVHRPFSKKDKIEWMQKECTIKLSLMVKTTGKLRFQ